MEMSRHGAQRMGQRRFSQADLETVLKYGREIYRAGALFIFLGERDIPADAKKSGTERLIGTTILVSSDEHCIITAYKNREALREIKKKSKRLIRKPRRVWH